MHKQSNNTIKAIGVTEIALSFIFSIIDVDASLPNSCFMCFPSRILLTIKQNQKYRYFIKNNIPTFLSEKFLNLLPNLCFFMNKITVISEITTKTLTNFLKSSYRYIFVTVKFFHYNIRRGARLCANLSCSFSYCQAAFTISCK